MNLNLTLHGYNIPVITKGKNLLPNDVFESSSYVSDYSMSNPIVYKLPFIEANKTYTISLEYNKGSECYFSLYKRKDNTNTNLEYLITNETARGKRVFTFTAEEGTEYFFYGHSAKYLETFCTNTSNFQIEEGSKATKYEPYVEPVITTINLNEPLKENEYISFKEDNLPNIPIFKGTTFIEVDTAIKPSKLELQ